MLQGFFWWERRDSNPRPSACKAEKPFYFFDRLLMDLTIIVHSNRYYKAFCLCFLTICLISPDD